jgi:hypothetical protein
MSLHGTVVFIPWHVLYQKLLNGNEQNLLLLVYKISPVWGKTFVLPIMNPTLSTRRLVHRLRETAILSQPMHRTAVLSQPVHRTATYSL